MGKEQVLRMARRNVGNPSPEEISKFIRMPDTPMLENFRTDRQKVLNDLRELKKSRKNCSRPALCAFPVSQVGNMYLDLCSERQLHKKDKPFFRFLFDKGWGIRLVAASVLNAEAQIAGELDEILQRGTAEVSKEYELFGAPPSVTTEVEGYLNVTDYANHVATLLREDPTGFLLVDTVVDWMKQAKGFLVTPTQTKEYMVIGAELARDAYKQLYEIAGDLYPSQPKE